MASTPVRSDSRKARAGGRRRRRYHHGDLPRALVDAAVNLVETEGVDALTLRGAARKAGVSQAAPYRHFADKQALLAAVAEEGFRSLTEDMRRASARCEEDPLGHFRALGQAYVEFALAHPAHYRVMFGHAGVDRRTHSSLASAANETFGLLAAAIRRCQQTGLVRPGDPEELALAVWSATHGLASLVIEGQLMATHERPLDTLIQFVMANIFFGLGSRGA
jgi:AcrR family transcriptional regulator